MIPAKYPSKKGDRRKWPTARNFSSIILKYWKHGVITQEKRFNDQFLMIVHVLILSLFNNILMM